MLFRSAIYATSWKPTGTTLYGTWCEDPETTVPAVNVTNRYLKLKGGDAIPRLSINLTDEYNQRIVRPIYAVETKTGQIVARGNSHDDTFDLNNHFNFSMPLGTEVKIYLDGEQPQLLQRYTFEDNDEVLHIIIK